VLIKAGGDGDAVATGAREIAASRPGIKVTTLGQTQRLISSSLTAVNLGGLTVLELGFAVLMVTGVAGLVLGLGLAERRRSFSILTALGAKRGRTARSFRVRRCWSSESAPCAGQ
jgi:putative ABC transport system permease protein